jgi:hypothetical protein
MTAHPSSSPGAARARSGRSKRLERTVDGQLALELPLGELELELTIGGPLPEPTRTLRAPLRVERGTDGATARSSLAR